MGARDGECGPTNTLASESVQANVRLEKLVADSASMQGRHPRQEDRHVKIPDLTKAAKALKMPVDHLEQPCAFFAIYDGHQGHTCAEFAAKTFHGKLLKRLSTEGDRSFWSDKRICQAMQDVCEELDAEFFTRYRTAVDGCTLVVTLITGTRLFTAWLGDCKCVVGRRGSPGAVAALALTEDHRPESEAARIRDAGGVVVAFGGGPARVAHEGYEERLREIRRAQALGLGSIAKDPIALDVSRSLGDRDFKAIAGRALLVPMPDVRVLQLDPSHKFFALVCGGIPSVMAESDVVYELDLLREAEDPVADVRAACGTLVQEAYQRGSEHNLTVVLVRFQWSSAHDSCYVRRVASVEKANASIVVNDSSRVETAVAASKRRRLEAAAAISAQKVAAYEKAVSTGQVAAQHAADAAKKEAELMLMRAEVEAVRAAAPPPGTCSQLDATDPAATSCRSSSGHPKQGSKAWGHTAGDGEGAACLGSAVDDAAEAFFRSRREKDSHGEAAEGRADTKGGNSSAFDAAEDFFAARKAKHARPVDAVGGTIDNTGNSPAFAAAEDFFAARRLARACAAEGVSDKLPNTHTAVGLSSELQPPQTGDVVECAETPVGIVEQPSQEPIGDDAALVFL